jgi:hypothetical protein
MSREHILPSRSCQIQATYFVKAKYSKLTAIMVDGDIILTYVLRIVKYLGFIYIFFGGCLPRSWEIFREGLAPLSAGYYLRGEEGHINGITR